MKKQVWFFLFIFTLLFAGCGAAGGNVVHQDGNLIVTNYSSREITDTTITHSGQTVAVSPDAIQDTQLCYFTIEPAEDYRYTVSFLDDNGEEHSQTFTDHFTADSQILIAVQYTDGVWTIDYDK